MNRVILAGNLGADPELRTTATGTAVMSLRMATTERRKGKDDKYEDHTEWHSVVVWGKRAEGLSKILTKGSKILIEGGLRTSSWEKDGQKRYKTEVHASEVELLGDKGGSRVGSRPDPVPAGEVPDDDDIPF